MDLDETGLQHLKRYSHSAKLAASRIISPQMSAGMFFLDFIVYPPIIIFCLVIAFKNSTIQQSALSVALVIFGYLFWTLAEYLIHRFVLHHVPFFSAMHKSHHDASRDLIGTPTIFTVVIFYCLAFWPIAETFGTRPAVSWFAGLLAGYFSYVSVHYAVHHLGSGGYAFMQKLKRQHALHHHGASEQNFGVTTVFWDRLFGTLAIKHRSSSL